MPKTSAGLLLFRRSPKLQVLLGHPGGPLWAKKDAGIWSIPKGELNDGEDPLAAARREFAEETGLTVAGPFTDLGSVTQKSGKVVHAWAVERDCDSATLVCNTFTMQWPPHSGKTAEFPEIDRFEWFDLAAAVEKINPAQVALLERLRDAAGDPGN